MCSRRRGTGLWLLLAQAIACFSTGLSVCHMESYVSSCVLNILEEHIEATAIVNHCHLPLDVTFLVTYQYKNTTRHSWKYTFVTSNQNERVLIPGLLLPTAPHAPVFLYARVPEKEFQMHNSSFVAIEAAFVAELNENEWEEADFLNHTVYITSTQDCRFTKVGQDPIPWIVGGLFAVAIVSGCIGGGFYLYRKKKLEVDQLALVTSMEAGLPGAQPYQMGAAADKNSAKTEAPQPEAVTPESSTHDGQDTKSEQIHPQQNHNADEMKRGKKGFKFGRLKEEKDESADGSMKIADKSVIIGNPAFQEEPSHTKNAEEGREAPIDRVEFKSDSGTGQREQHILENRNVTHSYTKDENEEISSNVGESKSREDLPPDNEEVPTDDLPIDGRCMDEDVRMAGGARPKVRGISGSITSPSTIVTADDTERNSDSQKCL